MPNRKRKRIAEILALLSEIYEKELSEAYSRFYIDLLDRYPIDKIEAAEEKIKLRDQEYAVLGEEVAQSRRKISAEIEARQQALAGLNRDLVDAREKIEPDLLAIFERTKQLQPNHIALARVVDAVCQGCNVTIPAQLYNELHRRDSLEFCPKCGRIAYWSESAR